jgi:TIGR03009 family protein
VRQVQGTDEDLAEESDEAGAPGRLPARAVPARGGKPGGAEPAAGASRLPRPEAEPLRIQKLSPELEQILRNWEQQTAKITKLQGDTRYREYDKTFSVEYRGEGRFAFEAPDRGNYELRPAKIAKGETSSVKTDDKQPYELKPKDAERWICTGDEILRIDETHKTYEVVPIPEERRGDRIIEAPLPFLFGMKAEQAKQRYQIELVKDADQEIVLKLRPNWSGDAANWSQATVVIQKTNYLPREVRLIAPGGTSMRIHSFENIKVNSDNLFRSLFGDDPFKPKLKNYKVVNNDRGPEGAPVTADRPDTSGKVRPSSAETPSPTKGARPSAPKSAGESKRPTPARN